MRRTNFVLAASCIVAATALLLAFASFAAEKPASEKVIYSFQGGSDGANPQSDLIFDTAGNLYGTTYYGGTATVCGNVGCGTVFELERTKGGWKERILYSFKAGADGALPAAGMIFDNSGNLFGTTAGGGDVYGDGTVFKLTPNAHGGWTEHILYAFPFDGSAGVRPMADLAFDSKGNLYGTTSQAVFELSPQSNGSWNETTIHTFTGGTDGGYASSGVVLDPQGNLYGMTNSGGAGKCLLNPGYSGCGIVYEFSPDSKGIWTENVIFTFARGGGYAVNPSGGVIFVDPNHLLATSVAGGNGSGTVLELEQSKKGWEQSVLYRFYRSPDGAPPVGKLVMDEDGRLFGATSYGGAEKYPGGTVFELRRSEKGGWKESILHSFGASADGNYPQAGVVLDSQGHVFGTTQRGGTGTACGAGCGTVYEVTP